MNMIANEVIPYWLNEVQGTWNLDGLHVQLLGNQEITIAWKGHQETFPVWLAEELHQAHLPRIMDARNLHPHLLLVARRISQPLKESLTRLSINFLEGNGNAQLAGTSFVYRIEGRRNLAQLNTGANRAFTETGLKVLLCLLTEPASLNLPQRQLAQMAGVALGNIPQVLEGLRSSGFLLKMAKNTYLLDRREELIDRWVTGYETVLRPKLAARQFNLAASWETLALLPGQSVWGGEPGADLLVHNLRPEKLLMFSLESTRDLIMRYKMPNAGSGNLEVLPPFWALKPEDTTAPPLVVYADLIISGDGRNAAVAGQILDDYLLKHV